MPVVLTGLGTALKEYRAGTQNHTTVVTAQALALQAAETLLGIQQNRFLASVALVNALGGGFRACLTSQSCPAS